MQYVAGEMKNVSRDLPRVVHSSMAIVVTLFTAVNLSYFLVLPRAVVGASNTVALVRFSTHPTSRPEC
jgi:amino acid transporter